MLLTGFVILWPFKYLKTRAYYRNLLSLRHELYSVRDGVYYNHFKKLGVNSRGDQFRGKYWM
jgi:ubiquinol-cytochrome c reductase cytochrome c1 subunit